MILLQAARRFSPPLTPQNVLLRSSTRQPLVLKLLSSSRIATPEPVRVRLPEDDISGVYSRSIPQWFKKEGDPVKMGEALCEVDAGDVLYDFNSPVSGWLVRITAKEGSSDLKGGEVIAYLAGSQDEITRVAYEAAREVAEHKVEEHDGKEEENSSGEEMHENNIIHEWFVQLGIEQESAKEYSLQFYNEGFTSLEALKKLDEDDLKHMGVVKRAHTKLILAGVEQIA